MRGILPKGNEIHAARIARGLTQRDLAKLSKLDIKTIRKAEQSVRLDAATIRCIAEALNAEYAQLIQTAPANAELHQEVVRKLSKFYDDQDIGRMLELYQPDAVLQLPGGPDIPFGGEFRGHEQIAQAHLANWKSVKMERMNLDECSFLIADEGVTLIGERGVYLPDGQLFHFSCILVFKFRDGLIAREEVQYDTLGFTKLMSPGKT